MYLEGARCNQVSTCVGDCDGGGWSQSWGCGCGAGRGAMRARHLLYLNPDLDVTRTAWEFLSQYRLPTD